MKLVVLHHDRTDAWSKRRYLIHSITPHLRKRGVEVVHHAGTNGMPEAEACLVHVDLSVVPERFRHAAERCPCALNSRMLDIRKRALAGRGDIVVRAPGEQSGPVMVKTDLNYAGRPERELRRRGLGGLPWRETWALWRAPWGGSKAEAYAIYGSPAEVPPAVWRNRHLTVERFLPEREGELYVLRWAFFLGAAAVGLKGLSREPVVRAGNTVRDPERERELPRALLDYRASIGLDYGKIDYVIHAGQPVVLDVNKTIGGSERDEGPLIQTLCAELADGFTLER